VIVVLAAKPSEEDPRSRCVITALCSRDELRRVVELGSLDELEPAAAALAEAYGLPCVVWATHANTRKPRGFDRASSAVGKVFRNPPAA